MMRGYPLSKNGILGIFVCVSLTTSNVLFAAEQANKIGAKSYQTPKNVFLDSQVWDSKENIFKKVNGKNYYGIFQKGAVDGVSLEFYNPKNPNSSNQERAMQILTPNISQKEIISIQGTHAAVSSNRELHPIYVVPFLVAGHSSMGSATNNKLVLKEGELSSVNFIKPSVIKNNNKPPKKKKEDNFNYLITAAIANKGNANFNIVELREGSYINMGVDDTYSLQLNGAPYVAGGVTIGGEVRGNKVVAFGGAEMDFHITPYGMTETNEFVFDERITHIIGGLAQNGSARDNQVHLNGTRFIMHGPSGVYSSYSAAHIAGAFIDVDDGKNHNAINNTLLIDSFNLGLKVDESKLFFYDSIFFGEFFGGKTAKGNANGNKIILNNVPSLSRVSKGVKVQGIYEFFGGYALEGKAEDNVLDVALKSPLQITATYLRQNSFGFYGAYASDGASNNTIKIRNNLTVIDGTDNINDRVNIIAGRTLAGKANNNIVDFKDSQVALPLYVYATWSEDFEGSIHYPEEAKGNKVSLDNVFGRKNIKSGLTAINVYDNTISYHNVEAQSSGESQDKESSVYIKAVNVAKGNVFRASNYWATSRLNIYGIRGEVEAYDNQVIFNNVSFNADRENSGLVLVGGVGASTYHNVLSIENIQIGEYNPDEDYIYIAASALPNAESNLALSYANTLYIGGDVEMHRNTILSALSGSIIRVPSYSKSNADIITVPAPSLGQLTEDNHLILEKHMHAKVINNFEHYSFIYHKDNKASFAVSLESPINLSSEAIISLLLRKGDNAPKKGSKIPLITSMGGFSDIDGNNLTSAEVSNLLETISKNKNTFKYSEIPQLQKAGLKVIPIKLSLGDDGRTIYAEI